MVPALLVALFLQAILFQFGGLTTLGLNTLNMALPAVVSYYLFNRPLRYVSSKPAIFATGFTAGAFAIVLSATLMALSLYTTGKEFIAVSTMVVLAHIPLMILEGIITGTIMVFLRKVRPEVLEFHK